MFSSFRAIVLNDVFSQARKNVNINERVDLDYSNLCVSYEFKEYAVNYTKIYKTAIVYDYVFTTNSTLCL